MFSTTIDAVVIGAGPAGLTAAYFLAKKGYHPTIFERAPFAGGMLRAGIPDYRLPPEVLEREVNYIKKLGAELQLNTSIGKDRTVAGLFDEGFKAVYLAVGAQSGRRRMTTFPYFVVRMTVLAGSSVAAQATDEARSGSASAARRANSSG